MRFLLLLLAAVGLTSCVAAEQRRAAQTRSTTVIVDPRIELMSVVQLLSDYPLLTALDHGYKADVQTHFAKHRGHRAVTMIKEMWRKDFRFSEVPTAFYAYAPPPELAPRRPLREPTIAAAGGEAQLAALMTELRDFAQVSDFTGFFARQQPFYAQLTERARPTVGAVIAHLESYVGTKLGDTTVVLGPLLHDGGFLASYEGPGERQEVVAFIGPVKMANGLPDFGDPERLDPLITHEFAHSVINPLAERHSAAIARSSNLHAAIAKQMVAEGYSSWDQTVYEHIIRAITVRLTTLHRGEAAGRSAMADEVKRGYVYVPALVRQLQVYETQRRRYPTIADFFPELLKAFS